MLRNFPIKLLSTLWNVLGDKCPHMLKAVYIGVEGPKIRWGAKDDEKINSSKCTYECLYLHVDQLTWFQS